MHPIYKKMNVVPNLEIMSGTIMGFSDGSEGKESGGNRGRHRRFGFDPWVGKIPWRRKWQSTLVFLPEKLTEKPGGLQSKGSQRVKHD